MSTAPDQQLSRTDIPRLTLVAIAYALMAQIILGYFSSNNIVSVVWPPSGLAIAALIIGGKKLWPSVFVGALLGNYWAGTSALVSSLIAIGNTLEALTCILLLEYWGGFDASFNNARTYWKLVFAGAVGSSVSALSGTVTLLAFNIINGDIFLKNFITWWQGDFLGLLLITPLVIVWHQASIDKFRVIGVIELAALLLIAFLSGQSVFLDWNADTVGLVARGYWMFLFAVWAAVRFERYVPLSLIAMFGVQALIGAAQHKGFFRQDIEKTGLMNFWFYMLILTVVGVSLSIVICERRRKELQLLEKTDELQQANSVLEEAIIERKNAEEDLRRHKDHLEEEVEARTADLKLALKAAEAANQAKSVFLASMSHELRTPLNAILGFSSLMRKDKQLRPEQAANLDIINRSGSHLLTLINDVLEMSKIEAGRVQLQNSSFDLAALAHDVVDMMAVRAREKGLYLLLEQAPGFPHFIDGDEARLRQVLINLIGNAVKFTHKGGVIVRLGMKENSHSNFFIEVADSGPGIAPEDQARIFQPFVQLGKLAGDNKGTGLGLAITQQFVQLMGGTISCQNELGKGALFRVDLPLREAKQADIALPQPSSNGEVEGLAPGQPKYRILIVEDQLENQLLLTQLMERIGFEVQAAEDGAQGVKLFQQWQPHLIWMDRRMPVMDGIQATKTIRGLPGGKEVKIVAITASVFLEQRNEMLSAGMDDFVRKPYRFNEVYECLARQLGVQYTYVNEESGDEPSYEALTPEMLLVLPYELRCELRDALKSLETERIASVIQRVAAVDAQLQKSLALLAEHFNYPAILDALNQIEHEH